MEQTLNAAVREGTGKGVARRLRAQNRVPAVLYGAGVDPVNLSVDARELFHVMHTDAGQNVLIDLHVDGGDTHLALAREMQMDHIKDRTVHVDFLAIRKDQKITVSVPVELVGSSAGVIEGGVLEHHLWDLEVECLPNAVPSHIDVDVSALRIGDSLHVSDIAAPEGTEITADAELMVVAVVPPQKPTAEDEAADLAEAEAAAEGEAAAAAEAASEEGGEG